MSREQIASSSRTPRLPAKRLEKPVQVSSSVSKPSSSKEKAIESDPAALVPLIPKVCFHLTLSKAKCLLHNSISIRGSDLKRV